MAHEIQHILSGESPVKYGTFIQTIIGHLKRSHSTSTMAKEDKHFKKEETASYKSIIEKHVIGMKRIHIFFNRSVLILLLSSCASSMTPVEVTNTLPTLTESIFYNQAQATEAINNDTCKLLVKRRTYAAPIGLTVNEALKNGARGIDEWVKMDGGNAFVLNYKWVNIGDQGGTQLHIDFDTMLCE